MERIAVCPGSFDPVTLGHLDIFSRASNLFDRVIVLVSKNMMKSHESFTPQERKDMILRVTKNLPNLEVDIFGGLLADYVKDAGAIAIVKGLRAVSDFEYEFQMSLTNKKLNPDLETIFLTSRAEYMFLSSSIVKQIATLNGDITNFVPECIHDEIKKRLASNV